MNDPADRASSVSHARRPGRFPSMPPTPCEIVVCRKHRMISGVYDSSSTSAHRCFHRGRFNTIPLSGFPEASVKNSAIILDFKRRSVYRGRASPARMFTGPYHNSRASPPHHLWYQDLVQHRNSRDGSRVWRIGPRGGTSSMKLQCSWCRKDLGYREPLSNVETTHGMCPDCLNLRVYPFVRQFRITQPKSLPRAQRRPEAER